MSQQSDPHHYSDIDPEYLQYYTPVYISTTSISLMANLTVIGFHWLMTWYKVAEFNRVSLRLIVFASVIGMVRSIVRLCMGVPADTATCLVDSFFLGWTEIAAPMCLGLVGVHAVCVLVLNVKNPLRLEKYYYMVIVLYSLVASVITVTHRTRNYPEDFYCWVRFYFGSKARQPFAWTWYFTSLLLPMTLAAICSLILIIRYRMERHNFVETSVRYAQNNNPYLLPSIPNRRRRVDPIKTFRNLVIRSAFYAAIPLFSKIFLVVSGITSLRGYSTNFYALMIGGVITNLQGLLISILYFSDPAVTFTLGRLGWFLRKVYVDEYQLPKDKSDDDSDLEENGPYDSDDLRPGDGSEDDIGGAIRITHDKHDMIAADTGTMEPTQERYYHPRHHCWRHHYGQAPQGLPPHYQRVNVDTTRRMQDPYRYRWLAKTMHLFLTSVCRLKPLPPTTSSDSTSTLSYHSRALSRLSASQTPISSLRLTSSSAGASQQSLDGGESNATTSNSITTDNKDRVPTVRFYMATPTTAPAPSTSQASTFNGDDQQLLALPTPTPKPNVSPHDSTYGNNHSSSSLLDNSGGSDDISDAKARGMGKSPMIMSSSSKLAHHSKKLGQVMLHRPETTHLVASLVDSHHHQQRQQPVSLQVSPPSPVLQPSTTRHHHRRRHGSLLSFSSPSSSHQLSVPSTDEDIDRLSLLSYAKSIEQVSATDETYEPLSAPPHYYQHRRHHQQQQQQATMPPQLSITLPDQEIHTQPAATFVSSTPPPSTPPETGGGEQGWKQHHGVALAPAVLKTLLDWGPGNTVYPAYVDQHIMASDGLGEGCTLVIHIPQSWTISEDKDVATTTIGDDASSSSSSRLVFFVEHWVKGYLGSRWFVVE